jgi:hypothetical protein
MNARALAGACGWPLRQPSYCYGNSVQFVIQALLLSERDEPGQHPVTASFTWPGPNSSTGREAPPATASTTPRASATASALVRFELKKSVSIAIRSGACDATASTTAACTAARRSECAPLGGVTHVLHMSVGRLGSPSTTASPRRSYPGSMPSTRMLVFASRIKPVRVGEYLLCVVQIIKRVQERDKLLLIFGAKRH